MRKILPLLPILSFPLFFSSHALAQDKGSSKLKNYMNTEDFMPYLEKYLSPFLKQHGFVLSMVNETGYEIKKEVDHVLYRCTCAKLKTSNGIYFEALSMDISFEKIENLLKDLLLKYGLEKSYYTLRDYDNSEAAREKRLQFHAIVIATEADFARYADAVKQFCNEVVFPFFDKYNNIGSFNKLIKEIPEDELTYHIGGKFQLKKMIVLKLCNDPEYDNYAAYVRQKFESIKDLEDGKYILNTYYELADRLKKGLH